MDDELSKFEHLLLGAHLAGCRDCRRFAADVEWQTNIIRGAELESLTWPVTIPARRSWRRPALGVSTAAVAASIAALAIGLHGPSARHPTPAAPTNVTPTRFAPTHRFDTPGGLPTAAQSADTFRGGQAAERAQ